MVPTLVFDIETVPDVAGLRDAWGLEGNDDAVAEAAFARRREQTGGHSDFLPLHLHRVIVISMLFRDTDGVRVHSLSGGPDDEGRLVQGFFRTLERHRPTLVSWNGSGFDLQVLHYRGMVHKVQAPKYWDQGEDDRDFKFNNYISRYHGRHTDLMDLLALYNGRANAPLDQLARLCGFPGKLGMDGAQVWPAWRAGRQDEIRDYCETDVANTWLLWCRFQLMRGALDPDAYEAEIALTRNTLGALPHPHWRAFCAAWPS
jgi:predicted PolB exonuclease-like 3'-5' exonuclease